MRRLTVCTTLVGPAEGLSSRLRLPKTTTLRAFTFASSVALKSASPPRRNRSCGPRNNYLPRVACKFRLAPTAVQALGTNGLYCVDIFRSSFQRSPHLRGHLSTISSAPHLTTPQFWTPRLSRGGGRPIESSNPSRDMIVFARQKAANSGYVALGVAGRLLHRVSADRGCLAPKKGPDGGLV
jgi:hypothetical protein